MKIAVMQPYFFPYVGYFELVKSVDMFVFLVDVQYVRGWINRNRIRAKDKPFQYLTVPVSAPRGTEIHSVTVADKGWAEEHSAVLRHTFGASAMEHELVGLLPFMGQSNLLSHMLCNSVAQTAAYLGCNTTFAFSNGISQRAKQERIIDICRYYKADEYWNLSGGTELYDPVEFAEAGVKLSFLKPTTYENKFSVLDACLTDEAALRRHLANF